MAQRYVCGLPAYATGTSANNVGVMASFAQRVVIGLAGIVLLAVVACAPGTANDNEQKPAPTIAADHPTEVADAAVSLVVTSVSTTPAPDLATAVATTTPDSRSVGDDPDHLPSP